MEFDQFVGNLAVAQYLIDSKRLALQGCSIAYHCSILNIVRKSNTSLLSRVESFRLYALMWKTTSCSGLRTRTNLFSSFKLKQFFPSFTDLSRLSIGEKTNLDAI